MALLELQLEGREPESVIGRPATLVPNLILEHNLEIASVQLKAGHKAVHYSREDKEVCLDGIDVGLTNKIRTVDQRDGWLLRLRYRTFTQKDVEQAKKNAIPVPVGWGFFLGDEQSLSFVGSVHFGDQKKLFEIIGRTFALPNIDHQWMAQQVYGRDTCIWLHEQHSLHQNPRIVGTIGI